MKRRSGRSPWLGRLFLAPRLYAANQAMFDDLARAAGQRAATRGWAAPAGASERESAAFAG